MCILIVKAQNVRKMTEQEIRNSASNNPDGFGMAYVVGGHLFVHKTFELNEIIDMNNRLPNDTPIIYHFRIATHGTVNVNNCHPFMGEDADVAFAHNGVLSIQNDKEKDWTDSETAFRYLFEPLLKVVDIKSEQFERAVNTIIGSSKFAFIQKNGDVTTFGNFINEDGLLFSNGTYAYNKSDWYNTVYIDEQNDVCSNDCYSCYWHDDYEYYVCYDDMSQMLDVYKYTDINGNFNMNKKEKEKFIDEWETWYGSDYPTLSKRDFKDILNCIIEELKVSI
jgi:predicted glutamine amidotransferase